MLFLTSSHLFCVQLCYQDAPTYTVGRNFIVPDSKFLFEKTCQDLIVRTFVHSNDRKVNDSVSISGRQVHLKFLTCPANAANKDDQDLIDAVNVELACLNGLCTQRQPFLLDYVGFQEFRLLDNTTTYYTVVVSNYIDGGVTFGEWHGVDQNKSFLSRLKVVKQIALALSFVHKQGYCHNDLSPHNVIVLNDNSVVLIDFGAAKPPGSYIFICHLIKMNIEI